MATPLSLNCTISILRTEFVVGLQQLYAVGYSNAHWEALYWPQRWVVLSCAQKVNDNYIFREISRKVDEHTRGSKRERTHDVEEQFELFVDPVFNDQSTTDQTHLMFRILGRQKPASRHLLLIHVDFVSFNPEVHVLR